MRSQRRVADFAHCLNLLLASTALGGAATALAQPAAPPAITELTKVDVQQTGRPPSGPYSVVIEHDPGLATHTIYRPSELTMRKHPVLVWGEGGCAKNGLTFPEYLSEIASYGVVVLADGPPIKRPPGAPPGPGAGGPGGPGGPGPGGPGGPGGRGGPGGAGPQAGGPPPGGPGAGGRPGAAPPNGASMVNGTALVAALDWLEAESAKRGSRFYKKVDVEHVAAMGMSCGGLMSYGASNDKRVATVGIWNSGLFPNEADPQANAKIYNGIHGSVIIMTGGESDIAYANGKRDFELMPAKVP
ncbi:MAG TPA: hypothetical protein VFX89_15065, partial [Gammaproteobacteria bacterium]|nr:hypothetical protein [Gammaproteobacteria bacterium]